MSEYILETFGLSKRFAGFTAVSDFDLRVKHGSIHAMIGPNGAGKTTVFNLLTKLLEPTSGRIVFQGNDITGLSAAAIARLGIVRSFQISAVFAHLSARDNIKVSLLQALNTSFHFWKSDRSMDVLNDKADAFLDAVGLANLGHVTAAELPYGRKRALEIATTLALEPKILLLDEPTAGLGREDIERVSQLIKRISADRTILMVEHNLKVVAALADTITVLTRGKILVEGPYSEISAKPEVREAYMGTGHG
mgnify:CR=1 FL=1